METKLTIEEIHSTKEYLASLSDLLVNVVEDGASIGFLPPLQPSVARSYWETALTSDVILYVAMMGEELVGSIQLHLCSKQNGIHRAEIAKLMTHPSYRRKGIGRVLMEQAEERARREKRSLIVLDTREGDASNLLYSAMGYQEAGRIPQYAKSANGELNATVFYYKLV